MDYIIGGAIVWFFSGALTLYSTCKPAFDGDKWERPTPLVCILMVAFGPFSHVIATQSLHDVYFKNNQ